ncbi:MAG: FecR domain-containing protein [Burkholderiaceae bacterium]|jgi:hypothetical protein|nr:FecR domain-containing protein [Burkholderiaceae bacterium]
MTHKIIWTGLTASILALAQTTALAQPVGRVLAVAGNASIERGGQAQAISFGTEVQNGDVLAVGDRSAVQVRFTDESIMALRANTQLKVQDFQYKQNAQSDRSVMALIKGGLRTITGLIGKNNARSYGIQTSTATVGIRGTHFTLVACNNDCANADGTAVPNGLFGGVTDGRISLTNNTGEAEFDQQENFYLASMDSVPERLLTPPSILLDRALVVRAKSSNAGDETASVDTKTEARTSDQMSNSTKLTLIRLLASDPQLLRAAMASGQYPGLVDAVTSQNNRVSYVQGSGEVVTDGAFIAATESGSPTVKQLRSEVDELHDKFFYDAESLAVQMKKTFQVDTAKGSGVYWTYRAPGVGSSNLVGTHIAFGDTPRIDLPTTGTVVYNYAGGTTPTDSMGRTGVINAGRLSVDFQTRQVGTLDPIAMGFARTATAGAVGYSIPTGTTWNLATTEQTLSNVRCVGCNGTPTALINGRIVGTTGVGYAAGLSILSSVGTPSVKHVGAAALAFGR